jgi:hypothetical protein
MTTNNFCFYLQNRLIQTSQTGGQQYSHTSPFSNPCSSLLVHGISDKEEMFYEICPQSQNYEMVYSDKMRRDQCYKTFVVVTWI